ncbi:hypothetical protein M408DRAFT_30661 [Serendipita vermifera MAFF 305830]|uniref:Uncharacterized protein n=1 Tax=Serendipita vermifera MAFF 305830 TaxID=933852 RepID=A0A0C2WR86_SERVB|nr:hypothetical protein M408DRAFT_30661 [Serendipita vermifera MAFF 305830]
MYDAVAKQAPWRAASTDSTLPQVSVQVSLSSLFLIFFGAAVTLAAPLPMPTGTPPPSRPTTPKNDGPSKAPFQPQAIKEVLKGPKIFPVVPASPGKSKGLIIPNPTKRP